MMNLKRLKRVVAIAAIGMLSNIPQYSYAQDGSTINDQVERQKEVDNGGSGRYRAIVVKEKSLAHFTVYRPRSVQLAAKHEGPLPILIWCNGACSGSNIGYERMLNEIASHGYVVVGLGAFQMVDSDPADGGSSEQMVVEAINWLVQQESTKTSDYYKAINVNNIALSGHSCGGAQAIANCGNSRVTTLLIMNAGMGGMWMGGASPESLNSLHCPIIYMTGGPGDVAYGNAETDFNNVKKQVAWADLSDAGHGGTYWHEYGGDFGKIAVRWMDWHMKGYKQYARIFLKPDLTGFSSNWSVKTRNFSASEKKYDSPYEDVLSYTEPAFDREAADTIFDFGADVSSLSLETRQGKVFYNQKGQKKSLMPILKEQGINSVRLRVLVNPTNNDFSLTYANTLAKTAKGQGLNIMADIHYSDWWDDNITPKAWANYDMEKLTSTVQTYTTNVVKILNGTGKLRWVQIGNDLSNGFLWPSGKDVANYSKFINAAHDAVKAVNPDLKTVIHVGECENLTVLNSYFDKLKKAGAQWDAIGLTVNVKGSTLKPTALIDKVVKNVKSLKQRYGKPVLIVETGYYNDRALEANQWLCTFLQKLIDAGAAGLYYWEPELIDDYDMGAFNPLTRKASIALDAFLGLRRLKGSVTAIDPLPIEGDVVSTEYFTPSGIKIESPQKGLNIVRKQTGKQVKTFKIFVK